MDTILQKMWEMSVEFLTAVWTMLTITLSTLWEILKLALSTLWDIITVIASFLRDTLVSLFEALAPIGEGIYHAAAPTVEQGVTAASGVVGTAAGGVVAVKNGLEGTGQFSAVAFVITCVLLLLAVAYVINDGGDTGKSLARVRLHNHVMRIIERGFAEGRVKTRYMEAYDYTGFSAGRYYWLLPTDNGVPETFTSQMSLKPIPDDYLFVWYYYDGIIWCNKYVNNLPPAPSEWHREPARID